MKKKKHYWDKHNYIKINHNKFKQGLGEKKYKRLLNNRDINSKKLDESNLKYFELNNTNNGEKYDNTINLKQSELNKFARKFNNKTIDDVRPKVSLNEIEEILIPSKYKFSKNFAYLNLLPYCFVSGGLHDNIILNSFNFMIHFSSQDNSNWLLIKMQL